MFMSCASTDSNSTKYSLNCINNSTVSWNFYMFQKMPNQPKDIFSLAWLVSPYKIAKNNHIKFEWSIDYTFIWANTGTLQPGVTYDAGGSYPCSPNGNNLTTFEIIDNAPTLSIPTTGGTDGSLTIQEGSLFPNSTYSTGIGMSGQGTFAKQALVNTKQLYTPNPEYYIAAADSVQSGCVLEQVITEAKLVKFPDHNYNLTATLTSDNTWSIV
jgi:hypothetical protein